MNWPIIGRGKYLALILTGLVVLFMVLFSFYPIISARRQDTQEVLLLGQTNLLAGSRSSLRAVVRNHVTLEPVKGASVRLTLDAAATGRVVDLAVKTDAGGTADLSFMTPEEEREYELTFSAHSSLGRDVFRKKIKVDRQYGLLLSTDKPLYQPGQKMNLRCLVLRKPDLKPETGKSVTFTVSDSKENKIYEHQAPVNDFGVAWTECPLADEVNQGSWTITCTVGEVKSERKVEVKHYTLPKFRVAIETENDFCAPGDTVAGRVVAEYFFGKPVAGAKVSLDIETYVAGFQTVGRHTGTTNDDGIFSFQIRMPDYAAGLPMKKGAAYLQFRARVTDAASCREEKAKSFTVSNNPFIIEAIPESGTLVPKVNNIVYTMVTYPDGRPAQATLIVGTRTFETNEMGIAECTVFPSTGERYRFESSVTDRLGNKMLYSQDLPCGRSTVDYSVGTMLLRISSAMPRVGETIQLTVLSSSSSGVAYVDAIRDGRTLYTTAVEMEHGRGYLALDISPDWAGTVALNAYCLGNDTNFVRDTKVMVISNASDLQVQCQTSKKIYQPGEVARLAFMVKDSDGAPRQAALGITVVDEALFALAELHPGLERMFFEIEKKLLSPKYEVRETPLNITLKDLYLDGYAAEEKGMDDTEPWLETRRETGLPAMTADLRGQLSNVLLSQAVYAVSYPLKTHSFPGKRKLREEAEKIFVKTLFAFLRSLFGATTLLMFITMMYVHSTKKTTLTNGLRKPGNWIVKQIMKTQFFTYVVFISAYGVFVSTTRNTPSGPIMMVCLVALLVQAGLAAAILKHGDKKAGYAPYLVQFMHLICLAGLCIICLVASYTGTRIPANPMKTLWEMYLPFAFLGQALLLLSSAAFIGRYRHVHQFFWVLASGAAAALGVFVFLAGGFGLGSMAGAVAVIAGGCLIIYGFSRLHLACRGTLTAAISHGIQWFLAFSLAGIVIPLLTDDSAAIALIPIGLIAGLIVYSYELKPLNDSKWGSRLLNYMIVFMIIGVLTAISIPDFNSARMQARGYPMASPERMETYRRAMDTAGKTEAMTASGIIDSPDSGETDARKKGIRVREYFPETLLSLPCIITDEAGRLELDFPVADSITSWRVSASASSRDGQLGGLTGSLTVFQDFFVDLDLPVSLTKGDIISIPAAVFNYLDRTQTVQLELEPGSWFTSVDGLERTVTIGPGNATSEFLTIKVIEPGDHRFTLWATGEDVRDAVRRSIQVLPFGSKHSLVRSGWLEEIQSVQISYPPEAVTGTERLFLKIYPTVFTQVVDGLDSILKMPHGCFEQTSSSTWPNLLVLNYLKTTGKISPKVRMKAEHYVQLGYQRLLTFEVAGGGFDWFGHAPANQILTAYGLMEFTDMSRVYPVDERLLDRTRRWLLSQQEKDGTWRNLNVKYRDSSSSFAGDVARTTAYITWALVNSGVEGRLVDRAVRYLKRCIDQETNTYTLALIANVLVTTEPNSQITQTVLGMLKDRVVRNGESAYWNSSGKTVVGSRGRSSRVETTALVAMAYLKAGTEPNLCRRAITHLISTKDASGNWYSTQSTILALKVLVEAAAGNYKPPGTGSTIAVRVNGEDKTIVDIEPGTDDVVRVVDISGNLQANDNRILLSCQGEYSPQYQLVGEYYSPWEEQLWPSKSLSIDVDYDRNELALDDILKAEVQVSFRDVSPSSMIIIDLGIPPGFSPIVEDFEALKQHRVLAKFSLTSRQATLYIREMRPGQELTFTYRLRARFPLRAKTPPSRVYEYYQPERRSVARPIELHVM